LEDVKMEEGVVNTLLRCSEGDLRKAITYLQSAARLVGAVQTKPEGDKKRKRKTVEDDEDDDAMDVDGASKGSDIAVSVQHIEEIAGVIPTVTIDGLLTAMQPSSKGTVYSRVSKVVEDLVAEGWSATTLTTQLYDQIIIADESIGDWQKSRIVLCFSETDKRLVDGSDEHLTILDLCLQVAGILGQK
jgi:replication factor C subunit 2/4